MVVVASLAFVAEGKKDRNDLLCTICLDVVEDIDSWLTSDTTEEQIVDWIDNICQVNTAQFSNFLRNILQILGELLSPDLIQMCEVVLGAQIPNIIDDLVNNNLNPEQVCQKLGSCSS